MNIKKFIENTNKYHVQGLSIIKDGQEIQRYLPEPEEDRNIYSGTKSFTSAAVGFAIQEKLFSLDDYVVNCFVDEVPDEISENLSQMRLIHLLTMSTGFETPILMGDRRQLTNEPNWVRHVLRQKVANKPGTKFLYSNAGPYLLGVLVQRRSGMGLNEYLKTRLFDPLGITPGQYEKCTMGYMFGAGGFCLKLSDFAKLGQLYLQKGVWDGNRLLSEQWIADSGKEYVKTIGYGDNEIGDGYGYLFWTMNDGMFRADGLYEQYCIVCPQKNAVITIQSRNTEHDEEKLILRSAVKDLIHGM